MPLTRQTANNRKPRVLAVEHRQTTTRHTPLHNHASGQLLGSLSGLLSVFTPTESWSVPATHAVWVPPRTPHALQSHGPFDGWSVYVANTACDALPQIIRVVRVNPLLRAATQRIASWKQPDSSYAEQCLVDVLLHEIATLPPEPLGLPRPQDKNAARIADALLANLADMRDVSAWAKWAGLSPRTLARRFVEETGFTFSAWRQQARCLRAMERLSEGASVTDAAFDMGYDNVSAFIAMFRRVTGMTPGQFSQNH